MRGKFDLIKEHHDFSKLLLKLDNIQEARAVNACLNRCFQKELVEDDKYLKVDVEYFKEVTGLPTLGKAYEELLKIIRKLKEVVYVVDLGDGKKLETNIIYDFVRDDSRKTISVQWHLKIIPLVFGDMPAGKFTFYDSRMAKVPSKGRLDMYKLIERNLYKLEGESENEIRKSKLDEDGRKVIIFSEEELRVETENENTYKNDFKTFIRRVVEPAVADIEKILGRKLVMERDKPFNKIIGVKLYDANDTKEDGKRRLEMKREIKRKEVGTKRSKRNVKDAMEKVMVGGK